MSDVAEAPAIKKEENDDSLDKKTLFVRAIPKEATSEELSEYFSQFVPVKHAVIVTDDQKQSRGFGFVSFTMEDDTLTALVEAKKVKFQGRYLRVDVAKRRDRKNKDSGEAREPRVREPREPVEKRKSRLIVRNLPWSCKDAEKLKKLFSKYGAVHDAYIPTKKGGLMKGFAFIVMKKAAAAEKAVKGSVGLKIDGREVAVDLALEKSKWEQVRAEEEPKGTGREREVKQEDEEEEEDNEVEVKEEEDSDVDSESGDEEEFDELNGDKEDVDIDEDEEEEEEEEPKEKQNKQEAYSIFVRNIPYDADREALTTHFSQFGPVKYALPVMDRQTGLAKGSAFVAFKTEEGYNSCLSNAPSVSTTSMLISDDVSPEYVFQGRILSIVSTVDRDSASKLAERNSNKRKELYGKDLGDKDRRNLFLLNEGRITEHSKLAEIMSKTDMEVREKSYKLRVQQLNKNPALHLSLTRLAIRNLPRAMTSKSLKALGRKAVVQYATEVKDGKRHPLSKEEISRSTKAKHELSEQVKDDEEGDKKKKSKHAGVVKQAKVIMEVKGSGETGRSRGYGFLEFRDHKSALMGLRWLNAHEVTIEELTAGLDEEEKKLASLEGLTKRRLIVEFAIENAQVVKRRKDRVFIAKNLKRKREEDGEGSNEKDGDDDKRPSKKQKGKKGKKGNMNKGPKAPKDNEKKEHKEENNKSGLSSDVKSMIGRKRKQRKGK